MVQPFTITQEQLKDIDYICPAGKNYNLHLNNGQHWELSESGKTLYLVNEHPLNYIKFIVSKTIFVLKSKALSWCDSDGAEELYNYYENFDISTKGKELELIQDINEVWQINIIPYDKNKEEIKKVIEEV